MSRRSEHRAVAAAAMRSPGTWVLARVYPKPASAMSAARLISSGTIGAYRPKGSFEAYAARHERGTVVWARYVAGLDVPPMPDSMTVRVPDYGTQPGYEGVRIVTVEISSRCPRCGGPRGPVTEHHFVHDGAHLTCDRWTNECGHEDMYSAVLAESRQEPARAVKVSEARPKPPIRGVEGGQYQAAVDLIGRRLEELPHMKATRALELVKDAGHDHAANVIARFISLNPAQILTSARSAALYLNDLDRRTRAAIADEAAHTKGAKKTMTTTRSWGHAIRPLTEQEQATAAGTGRATCATGRCTEQATHLATYSYITGRSGRVSSAARGVCTPHAEKFAAQHNLTAQGGEAQ